MEILESYNISVGVDIVDNSRFTELDRKKDVAFLNRIFSLAELDYCYSHRDFAPHLAARFAAKEAVVKALAMLSVQKIEYNAIEIIRRADGVLEAKVADRAVADVSLAISLSHTRDMSVAFAIAQKR